MKIFIWRENNISFSRYLDVFIFVNPQISKYLTSSLTLLHNESYTFACFFWILSTIKRRFGQILLYLRTNISNMFLAQCWRLETSSRSFYDFNEMTISWDLSIFSSWYVAFLILPFSPFQKEKKPLETWTWHNWLLGN